MRRHSTFDNLISFDDLLMCYVHHGIIGLCDIAGSPMEETVNKIIKKVHKYKIQKPKEESKDKRWFTYIPDKSNPRGSKRIAASSEKELQDILFKVYAEQIKALEAPKSSQKTMGELFQEWTNYKESFCKAKNKKKSLSPSTINRYRRDYKTYVKGTKLDQTEITDITSVMLEQELKAIIENNHLKESFSKNLLGYFKMAFRYARQTRQVESNEFDFVNTDIILSFAVNDDVKSDEERSLTKAQLNRLIEATRVHEEKHPYYMPDYAIELESMTGMRVGELAVLHWTDIDWEAGYIKIDYSEHRIDYEDHSELIIGEPKNLKHRRVPIDDGISELFERIKALGIESDFVFARRDGTRYTAHDISCAVARRAKEAGVGGKSSIHRIRRTVVSELRKVFSPKLVSELMGHTEETDENNYNYDNSDADEKLAAIKYLTSNIIPFEAKKLQKTRDCI